MLDFDAIYGACAHLAIASLDSWGRGPDYFGFLGVGAGLLWALRRPVRNSLVFLLFLKGKSTILGQVAPGGPREAIPDYSGLFRTGLGWAALLAFDARF